MPGTSTDFTGWITGKSEPDVKGELVTFDPRFKNKQDQLFKDWRGNRADWKATYDKWLRDFTESTPEYEKNIGSENEFLRWLQDGGLSTKNAGFRVRERAADEAAQKNALDFAENRSNFAKVVSGMTGSSSADYARRLAAGRRISDDFAGRDVARERADFGNETNLRLGLQGKLNENLDKLLNRQLMPQHLSDAELNALTASLNAIGSGTQFGAQPKFWEDKDWVERIGAFTQGVGDTYYGGGARAGATQPLTTSTAAQAYTPQTLSYATTPQQPNADANVRFDYSTGRYEVPANAGVDYDVPSWQDYSAVAGYV